MLFNSFSFLVFLPLVFIIHWSVAKKNLSLQNGILLVASYFFYACWDYRFLFLLVFSTVLDYATGLKMAEAKDRRHKKKWFWLSVVINLALLGVFKYYNFFIVSFSELLVSIGFKPDFFTLQIILPIGISFYTFHGLSYVIDIYNDKIQPERNFSRYALFVSFFPLLVAGPIERATHLLPQLQRQRIFDYARAADGLKQILWGFFKKVVIADSCATYANMVFNNSETYSGSTHALAAVAFAFQIYCDFSGYSDIALGTARLFGIELLRNFNFPYFSRDIAEFWRRWHISLTSWFKDYLYIPLGGSRRGLWITIRNTFIVFLVSGFWHGANWTFLAWGLLHAFYFLPLLVLQKNRNHLGDIAGNLPSIKQFLNIFITFILTTLAWIFFRSDTIGDAFRYMGKIFSGSLFSFPQVFPLVAVTLIIFLLIIEWTGRKNQYGIQTFLIRWPRFFRWSFYYCLLFFIHKYFDTGLSFIYFQF
jgi:alginate O-acetyltransferase complex protein AlgI